MKGLLRRLLELLAGPLDEAPRHVPDGHGEVLRERLRVVDAIEPEEGPHPHPETVPCGGCGALELEPCRNPAGRVLPWAHPVRHMAAREADRLAGVSWP